MDVYGRAFVSWLNKKVESQKRSDPTSMIPLGIIRTVNDDG